MNKLNKAPGQDAEQVLFDVYTVGKILFCGPQTVRRLVQRGELQCLRVGRLMRFRKTDIEAYIEREMVS